MVYYKYRTAEEGIKILENLNIWFCNPLHFNDKKDCRPNFKFTNHQINNYKKAKISLLKNRKKYGDKITKQGLAILNQKAPADLLKDVLSEFIIQDVRILSLSTVYNNPRMWGQYANQYSGIVIGLNQLHNIFIHNNICYYKSLKKCLNFTGTFDDYYSVSDKGNDDICNLFIHKDNSFSYEKEFRYICLTQKLINSLTSQHYLSTEQKLKIYTSLLDNKGFNYPLNKYDITEIYLGFKINILDKLHILSIIKTKMPNVKIYQMKNIKRGFAYQVINIGEEKCIKLV